MRPGWHRYICETMITLLLSAAWTTALAEAPNPPRPNIVFIYADDLGYGDLACYGSPVARTPHLDRLAAEGTRFTQFYVSHCVCSPTRSSAITGHFPSRHRIYAHLAHLDSNQQRHMPNFLDVMAPSLPRALQRSGYRTAMIGKWHLGGGSGHEFHGRAINDPQAPPLADYGFDHARTTFGNSPTWRNAVPWPQVHDIYPYVLGLVDFVPTFCRLAGASMPAGYQADGVNIADAFEGKPFRRQEPLFWHHPTARQRSPTLAVRHGDWKLLMDPDGSRLQLYELTSDPAEQENVADQHAELLGRLRSKLHAWYRTLPEPYGTSP